MAGVPWKGLLFPAPSSFSDPSTTPGKEQALSAARLAQATSCLRSRFNILVCFPTKDSLEHETKSAWHRGDVSDE